MPLEVGFCTVPLRGNPKCPMRSSTSMMRERERKERGWSSLGKGTREIMDMESMSRTGSKIAMKWGRAGGA